MGQRRRRSPLHRLEMHCLGRDWPLRRSRTSSHRRRSADEQSRRRSRITLRKRAKRRRRRATRRSLRQLQRRKLGRWSSPRAKARARRRKWWRRRPSRSQSRRSQVSCASPSTTQRPSLTLRLRLNSPRYPPLSQIHPPFSIQDAVRIPTLEQLRSAPRRQGRGATRNSRAACQGMGSRKDGQARVGSCREGGASVLVARRRKGASASARVDSD